MTNKVAASFGVVMAIFIVLALTFWGFSAAKHSRHNTAKHNRAHHFKLDDWIKSGRNTGNDHRNSTADIEMQVPVLPRRPENAYTRTGPNRVSKMDRIGGADRVEFCNVPLGSPSLGSRGGAAPAAAAPAAAAPAGFF